MLGQAPACETCLDPLDVSHLFLDSLLCDSRANPRIKPSVRKASHTVTSQLSSGTWYFSFDVPPQTEHEDSSHRRSTTGVVKPQLDEVAAKASFDRRGDGSAMERRVVWGDPAIAGILSMSQRACTGGQVAISTIQLFQTSVI